jgi:putative serine protease PepD
MVERRQPVAALPSHLDPFPAAPATEVHPVHRHPRLADPLPTHPNPIEHRPAHPRASWGKRNAKANVAVPVYQGGDTAQYYAPPSGGVAQPVGGIASPTSGIVQPTYGHAQPVPYQQQEPVYASAHDGPERRSNHVLAIAASALIAAMLASGLTAAALHVLNPPNDSGVSIGHIEPPYTPAPVYPDVSEPGAQAPGGFAAPDWERVATEVADSVIAISAVTSAGASMGSGFILDATGNIITNAHVVGGATDNQVQVTLADGRMFIGDIIGLDEVTDLAVVKLVNPPNDLHPVVLGDSSTVRVGAPVLAAGNPLGLANTVTQGIVSALNRPVSPSGGAGTAQATTNAIQIDNAINPGNSGGPLFNANGQVVGVTSSIASLTVGFGSQGGSIGLGFAIPVNLARQVTAQMIETGEVRHARIGVRMEANAPTVTINGVTRRGAQVQMVVPDSPAEAADIQVGDVIVAFNGMPTTSPNALTGLVREMRVGDEVSILLVRGNEAIEKQLTLDTLVG